MKTEQDNLNRMKGENPFRVPEGYFEGLTADVMNRLPQKLPEKEAKISWMDRVRPWLYMAAVFAGLGLFFKALVQVDEPSGQTDSLLVKTDVPATTLPFVQEAEEEEEIDVAATAILEDEKPVEKKVQAIDPFSAPLKKNW